MNEWQRNVTEFHDRMGITIGEIPDIRDALLRAKLIAEEAVETISGLGYGAHFALYAETDYIFAPPIWEIDADAKPDIVEMVDGLADLIYVTIGTAVAAGVDLAPIFRAVHNANMAKVGGPVREDGKQMKPEGWTPPDIARILENQGNIAVRS